MTKNGVTEKSKASVVSIQVLRCIAATLVVIFHSHLAIVLGARAVVSSQELYFFGFGAVGVHIFFVISGYIMYLTSQLNHNRKFHVGQFLYRRFVRVYPTYWTFVALYMFIEFSIGILPNLSPSESVRMLLLWPVEASKIIGPAWTLSYEIYFYIVFGGMVAFAARRAPIYITLFFIICIAARVVIRPTTGILFVATNTLLLEFLAGVWIGHFTENFTVRRVIGIGALMASLAGYVLGLMWGYDRLPSVIAWGLPSAALVFSVIVIEQTMPQWRVPTPYQVMAKLGNSSYSLYLCHIIFVTVFVMALRRMSLPAVTYTGTILITASCIAFAHLFYLTVERPMVKTLNHLGDRLAGRLPRSPSRAI